MQILLDPNPSLDTRNVLGRDAFQNVNDMVRALATLQSGDTRPVGIKSGEFWCKDIEGNGTKFQIYRYIEVTTPDGVQGLDVPLTIELAQSINHVESARDDVAPSEKAVALSLNDKLNRNEVIDSLTSSSTTSALSAHQGKILNDKMGKVRLLATRTSGGAVTLTDVVIGKPIFIISCFKTAASGSMCHARYSVIFGSEHNDNDISKNGTTHIFGGQTNYVSPSTNGTGYVYGNQCAVVIPAETTVEVAIEKVVGSLEIKFFQ